MDGSLADVAITPQERLAAANAERVAELLATTPAGRPGRYEGEDYIPPIAPNVTNLMLLESLDPEAAQREKLQANPPKAAPGALSAADAQWVNAEAARIASLNMVGGHG